MLILLLQVLLLITAVIELYHGRFETALLCLIYGEVVGVSAKLSKQGK
jgi:hypothetical protein